MRVDHDTVTETRVADHTAGTDADALTERHAPFEDDVDVDDAVDAGVEFAAHVEPRRIAQRDATGHQSLGGAPLKHALEAREFGTIVDPGDFVGAGCSMGHDVDATTHGETHDIRQIQLALRIVALKTSEQFAQQCRRRGHDSRIDLA